MNFEYASDPSGYFLMNWRAWHAESGVMFDVVGTRQGANWSAIVGRSGSEQRVYDAAEVDLMRPVGLRAGCGSSVYEGDILDRDWDPEMTKTEFEGKKPLVMIHRHVVVWLADTAAFAGVAVNQYPWNSHIFWHHADYYRVVGNVYQNPEIFVGDLPKQRVVDSRERWLVSVSRESRS